MVEFTKLGTWSMKTHITSGISIINRKVILFLSIDSEQNYKGSYLCVKSNKNINLKTQRLLITLYLVCNNFYNSITNGGEWKAPPRFIYLVLKFIAGW